MALDIKKLDEVWTADARKLGLAQRLYHRLEGVNPDLQYYATYLEVENYEFGSDYFVPMDFVAGHDPEAGKVELAVTFDSVMERTWSRMPDFVARGAGRAEELAPR